MKETEDYLKAILNYGADGTFTSKALAETCQTDERRVRLAVRELIAGGLPVASSTDGRTGGYFIADTREEAQDYMGKLRHRIIQDCLRLRDFKRAARSLLNPGQMPLI